MAAINGTRFRLLLALAIVLPALLALLALQFARDDAREASRTLATLAMTQQLVEDQSNRNLTIRGELIAGNQAVVAYMTQALGSLLPGEAVDYSSIVDLLEERRSQLDLDLAAVVAADGRALSLAEWRAAHPGQAVGVYFWAEWCPICTAQEGTIDGVQADYPVLTVAMQSGDAAAVNKVLAERGLDWTTAIDADGRIAQTYGLRGVPAFVIVDPAGQIRSVSLGYTTGWGLRTRLWWAGFQI